MEDYYQGVLKKSSKLGDFPFDTGVGATNTMVEEVQVLFREPSSPQETLVSQPLAPVSWFKQPFNSSPTTGFSIPAEAQLFSSVELDVWKM